MMESACVIDSHVSGQAKFELVTVPTERCMLGGSGEGDLTQSSLSIQTLGSTIFIFLLAVSEVLGSDTARVEQCSLTPRELKPQGDQRRANAVRLEAAHTLP